MSASSGAAAAPIAVDTAPPQFGQSPGVQAWQLTVSTVRQHPRMTIALIVALLVIIIVIEARRVKEGRAFAKHGGLQSARARKRKRKA